MSDPNIIADNPLTPVSGPEQGRWFERLRARAMKSPLARRAMAGTIWSLLGAVGGKGLSLLAAIYSARLLGKETYGEFGIVQSTVASFGLFAGLALGLTANKFVAQFRDNEPARAGRIVALSRGVAFVTGLLTALAIYFSADHLASGAMAAPQLALEIKVASLALFLGAVTGAQNGALYGFEAFQAVAKINLISGVVGFVLTVVCVRLWGLVGCVWSMVAGAGVGWFLNYWALRIETRKYNMDTRIGGALVEWRTLGKFTVPAVLSGLSVIPINWACNLILVNQHNGYAEMGMLNAAIQWRNIILFVPGVLMSVALPMLANLQGQHGRQKKLLLGNVAAAAVIGFGVAIGVALFARLIMRGFGDGFELGRNILILQAFAAAIAAVVGVLGQFLVSLGEMWWLIFLQLIWATVSLGFTWLFRERGGVGVSEAYLLAYLVHLCTMSGLTFVKLKKSGAIAPT